MRAVTSFWKKRVTILKTQLPYIIINGSNRIERLYISWFI